MKLWQRWAILGGSMALCGLSWGQASSAMVLQVQGSVALELPGLPNKPQKIEPLIRLLAGDRVQLAPGAHLRLLYAHSGLQEDWKDAGVLRIDSDQSTVVRGQPQRETRQLARTLTQQMARTPQHDSTARIGGVRLRTIQTVADLEAQYQTLHDAAPPNDRGPEIAFLAGLWGIGAHERLRSELQRLNHLYPDDAVVARLHTLYTQVLPAPGSPIQKDAAKSPHAPQ